MLPRVENLPGWILLIAVAWGVCLTWPGALLYLFTDGMFTAALLGGAWGLGALPATWLLGRRWSRPGHERRNVSRLPGSGSEIDLGWESRDVDAARPLQRRTLAIALGMGILATAALALGMNGLLTRHSAWTMVVVGLIGMIADIYLSQSARAAGARSGGGISGDPAGPRESAGSGRRSPEDYAFDREAADRPRGRRALLFALFLAPLVFPAVVLLCGSTLPPGLVWAAEGNAYDVLEYHLQAPREYFEAGRIRFLPHNVYAQFPQQMEMLYLLLMHMAGGVYAGAIPSQILHAACGGLTLLALGAWSRPGLQRIVTVVAAGSVPWLAYVGILAYVENGILFFSAVAAGLLRSHLDGRAACGNRTALAAGLCAGLAGGCKYPALALVGPPLGLAWIVIAAAPLAARLRHALLFFFAVTLAFSPWLVRNWRFTDNPVYPFAYELFGGKAWSVEQAAQWREGHRPKNQATAADTLNVIRKELPGSPLFGAGLFSAALLGVVVVAMQPRTQGRRRPAPADRATDFDRGTLRLVVMLCLWSAAIFVIWLTTTHLPGRFAMPLIVPLAMLAGLAVTAEIGVRPGAALPVSRAAAAWLAACFVTGSGLMNNAALASECVRASKSWWDRTKVALGSMVGRIDLAVDTDAVSAAVPADGKVLHVGNAAVFYTHRRQEYSVVFNRYGWLPFCENARDPAACVNWLRRNGFTHVVFSWSEIDRLRRTYGFPAWVTPEWAASLETAGLRRLPEAAVKLSDGRPAVDIFVVEAAAGE